LTVPITVTTIQVVQILDDGSREIFVAVVTWERGA